MQRLAGLVLALVLVRSAPAGAATATEDVPVPGGSAALSRLLGIDPPPDRGRFLYEITRLIYDNPEGRRPEADRYIQWLRQPPGRKREVRPAPDRAATDSIPVPLTADVWADVCLLKPIRSRLSLADAAYAAMKAAISAPARLTSRVSGGIVRKWTHV